MSSYLKGFHLDVISVDLDSVPGQGGADAHRLGIVKQPNHNLQSRGQIHIFEGNSFLFDFKPHNIDDEPFLKILEYIELNKTLTLHGGECIREF